MIQKDKARVDIFGEHFRTHMSQLASGLRAVTSYINEHREAVLEQTAMEITATLSTPDATVIRAIQALGSAGLRNLERTLKQWLGPVLSSSKKMSTAVSNLTSDTSTAIDLILEGHLYTCNVLSEPKNCHALAQTVALLAQARQVVIFGIGASGILANHTARLFNRTGLPVTALNHTGVGFAEQLIVLQRGNILIMMARRSAHRGELTTLRETRRLGIPVILLTNALDSCFSKDASIVIRVLRGDEKEKTPLHGTVLLCLGMTA